MVSFGGMSTCLQEGAIINKRSYTNETARVDIESRDVLRESVSNHFMPGLTRSVV